LGTNPFVQPTTGNYPTIGQPFTINWDATNQGPQITLSLYQGCPDNCVEVTDIVGGLANTGTYTWNVQCTADWPYLKADETALGYAIFLIDETGCRTQWSENFGLHPDADGCCNNGATGCGKAAASSALTLASSTTTTLASKTTLASSATTATSKASSATTATSAASSAASAKTLKTTAGGTGTLATGTLVGTATASAVSGAAVATGPAQALGAVALMAAGMFL
jgi:hypothetical protein